MGTEGCPSTYGMLHQLRNQAWGKRRLAGFWDLIILKRGSRLHARAGYLPVVKNHRFPISFRLLCKTTVIKGTGTGESN